MFRMLTSSAVDCGFELRSGQTKDYKIGICWFSAKHAAYYSLSYQNSHTQNMLKYKQIFNINISILSYTKYAEI
jgi:hypothetical protein